MGKRGLVLMFIGCFILVLYAYKGSLPTISNALQKELKALAGTWKPIAGEEAGVPIPKDYLPLTLLVISADGKIIILDPNGQSRGTITVNPSKDPKQMEIHILSGILSGRDAKEHLLGIYELKGNKLSCVTSPAAVQGVYPQTFSTKGTDEDSVMIVFERASSTTSLFPPNSSQAEMMGRVEHLFLDRFRDVTARKSIEWGEIKELDNGNRSIRYKYNATILNKNVVTKNQVFTFDEEGGVVNVMDVDGFPKKKTVDTKEGMMGLVEEFFRNNLLDIVTRETIEWGEPVKQDNGNLSISYRYIATILGRNKQIMNQIFLFDAEGNYLEHKDIGGFPEKE